MNIHQHEAKLYVLQRLSAVVMAPLVIIHLITILYAIRGGLSAAEILDRTEGASIWGVFYLIFVLAVSIHAPLGLRKILREWTPLSARAVNRMTCIVAAVLLVIGIRSVMAVTGIGLS